MITLSFMGLRTMWTDWPHGYANEYISFLIMSRSCRLKPPSAHAPARPST